MADPRDEIDEWLGREVEPLPPPPGTYARIQRRARRRKLQQALVTAAAAVVVVAGAALTPTVARGLLHGDGRGGGPVAGGGHNTKRISSRSSPARSSTSPAPSPTVSSPPGSVPAGTALSRTTSGTSAPAHFRPTSITMISSSIGAVIGQAGTPGHCSGPKPADCTSLAGTSSYGASWYGVSAPVTSAPDGATGVGQVRFLDLDNGWAFGPELWTTKDGGLTWTPEQTLGLRVTGLETAGDRAFAVLASCQGSGAAYAANCSTFELYSSLKGSTRLQKVPLVLPAKLRAGAMGRAGQPASASLVLTGGAGGTGYLLSPTGAVLSGPLTGRAWRYAGKAPCPPGPAAAGGSPLGAQLAAGGGSKLLLDCAASNGASGQGSVPGSARQDKTLWVSSSSGARWRVVGKPPAAGRATSLATASQGQVLLATSAGIDYSPDGTSWQTATITGGPPPGGFSYVGMTTAQRGVAVPVDAKLGEVFVTADGGRTWSPRPIAG